MRARAGDPPTAGAADGWRFVDARTLVLLPDGTIPAPGVIYDLIYRARSPWVSGIGFAAQRDVVAFLKSNAQDAAGATNPAGGQIQAAIGFGVSQSGRFLRDFIKLGFNQDEAAGRCSTACFSHIAGIGGVFLNAEFAQPFRTRTQHQDLHHAGEQLSVLGRDIAKSRRRRRRRLLRHDGFDPLLIETNTDAEYWQKGASLLGTEPLGKFDLPSPARLFLIAGSAAHRSLWREDAAGPCANRRNPHDPYPAVRALLVALSEWIATGRPAPESRIPMLGNGTASVGDSTLVPADRLHFPPCRVSPSRPLRMRSSSKATGCTRCRSNRHTVRWCPQWMRMATIVPDCTCQMWPCPSARIPASTSTKRHIRTGEMCDRDGSFLPFARSEAEKSPGDPRRSMVERYGTREQYVARVTAEATRLVSERLLLPEDADHYVAEAKSVAAAALPQ